jgi:bacteriocin biosynthesis cyclodehydratase domain-containing protein
MRESLPERPLLKPWYRLAHTHDGLVLEYGQAALMFQGAAAQRLLPALLPLLDGERTLEDIGSYLGEPIFPAIRQALELLARHGAIASGSAYRDQPRPLRDAAWHLAAASGDDVDAARRLLRRSRVEVRGNGPVAEESVRLLRLAGVGEVAHPAWLDDGQGGTDVVVAVPDPGEIPALRELNELALRVGFQWLQALPFDGRYASIGPLFIPGETCCYDCFRLRQAANLEYPDELRALERSGASYPVPAPLVSTLAGLATTLALNWLGGRDPSLPGVLHTLELRPVCLVTRHHVYRVPRCPTCSGLEELAAPSPWFESTAC